MALKTAEKQENIKKAEMQPTTSKYAPSLDDLKPLGKKTQAAPTIPAEHSFLIKDLADQTMAVLAEDKSHFAEDAQLRTGKLFVEGRVLKRAECRPPATLDYMKMKMSQIELFSQPKHTVKLMDKAEVKFKPTAFHKESVAHEKLKKEAFRTVRVDSDVVMKEIFQAFERHQYYRLTDLQRITNQPANYLKEILINIANYNTTQPHKNMWELKPEYRDYETAPKEGGAK